MFSALYWPFRSVKILEIEIIILKELNSLYNHPDRNDNFSLQMKWKEFKNFSIPFWNRVSYHKYKHSSTIQNDRRYKIVFYYQNFKNTKSEILHGVLVEFDDLVSDGLAILHISSNLIEITSKYLHQYCSIFPRL